MAETSPIILSLRQALKRVSSKARMQAVREIGMLFNIIPGRAKKNISLIRKGNELLGGIRIKSRREWKLSAFKFKWGRKMAGAEVEVRKGTKVIYPRTFVPILKSPYRGVYIRKGTERFPIVQPTVPQNLITMFNVIESKVNKKVREEFPKEVKRASLYHLYKAGKKREIAVNVM